jgi:hypothetical protein
VSEPIAHPYARISDPEQRKGGGLHRQTSPETQARIKEFCRLYGFRPNKHILVDDGISAWKGLNATPEHALGRFIQDANQGIIRPGDCLLVELLDRITRQDVWAAMALVNDLRQLGIHIGRLDRMKLLRCDSKDMGDFFEAAVEFSRGNSESEAKSYRNGKKWAERRQQGRENGKTITRKLPAWIQEVDGERVLIPQHAKTIEYIFKLSAEGRGFFAVMRKLNDQGVAAFGPSGRWSVAYIQKLLSDRRVLGEFQPRIGSKGKGKADGEPIPDYFPRVIPEALWFQVRGGAEQRRRRPGKVGAIVNVFAGLLKDALAGTSYTCGVESKTGQRTLRSSAPRVSAGKANSIPLLVFESAFFYFLDELDAHAVLNGDSPDETGTLAGQLEHVRAKIAENERVAEESPSEAIARVLARLEVKEKALAKALAEARQRAASPLSEVFGSAKQLVKVIHSDDGEEKRLRLRAALRRIIGEIRLLVVPRGRERLAWCQVWFSNGKRRDYLLHHSPMLRTPRANRPAVLKVESKPQLTAPIDLRKPDDARKLESYLAAEDIETLTANMKKLAF